MSNKATEWRQHPLTAEFFNLVNKLRQAEIEILVSGSTLNTKEGAKNSTAYQVGLIQGFDAVSAIEFEGEQDDQ